MKKLVLKYRLSVEELECLSGRGEHSREVYESVVDFLMELDEIVQTNCFSGRKITLNNPKQIPYPCIINGNPVKALDIKITFE